MTSQTAILHQNSEINRNSVLFCTNIIPPNQRISYWRDIVSKQIVDLDYQLSKTNEFYASLDGVMNINSSISSIDISKIKVLRTNDNIKEKPSEDIIINMILSGSMRVAQLGTSNIIIPGDYSIIDASLPYQLDIPECTKLISIRIDKNLLCISRKLIQKISTLNMISHSSLSSLLRAYITELFNKKNSYDEFQMNKAIHYLSILLDTTIEDIISEKNLSRLSSKEVTKLRIKEFVTSNISNAELSATMISEKLRISKRYLFDAFSNEEVSLSNFIQESRLKNALDLLSNEKFKHLSISDVAFYVGYSNVSHFSTSFKNKFNTTPSEYKNRNHYLK